MSREELKNVGLRVTTPRVKILDILENSTERHMSVEDVYKQLTQQGHDVGLATVYRVLTQFEASGLVIRHKFEGGHSVFELDNGEHHDHMMCIKCGKVAEFVDDVIETRQQRIADQHNFTMTDHALYIYGICQDCN